MLTKPMKKAIDDLKNCDERAVLAVLYYVEHGEQTKEEMIKFLKKQIKIIEKSID